VYRDHLPAGAAAFRRLDSESGLDCFASGFSAEFFAGMHNPGVIIERVVWINADFAGCLGMSRSKNLTP